MIDPIIDVISDSRSISKEATKIRHCKNITEVLLKHYPDHLWGVALSDDCSMTYIRCFSVSGEMGYSLHTNKLNGDDMKRKVKVAGGEILERYNMSRGMYRGDEHADLKMTRSGRIICDAA